MSPWSSCLLIAVFVTIGFFIYVPAIVERRRSNCRIVPSGFDGGYLKSGLWETKCSTIQWKERTLLSILSEENQSRFSTLDFDLDSYYLPMSTGPKIVKPSNATWVTGSDTFMSYMNTFYIPKLQNSVHNATDQIIYQKKGSTGIANQMFGVCDILLLGILNNRSIQINAPGIPNHFFSFPLFNLTFPATLPFHSELYRYSRTVDVSNQTVTLVDYMNRASIPGVTNSVMFNSFYSGRVIFNASTSMLRYITIHRSFSHFIKRLNETANSSKLTTRTWYPICLRSVFQPSNFLMSFLHPFLALFENHFLLGVHIRMAGSLSVWKDDVSGVTGQRIQDRLPLLNSILHEHANAFIFLSTDSRDVERNMTLLYPGLVKTVGDLPRMHTGRLTTEAGLMRVYLELFILSKCDVLFLTPGSALSRVSRLMNAKSPNVTFF